MLDSRKQDKRGLLDFGYGLANINNNNDNNNNNNPTGAGNIWLGF